MNCIICNLDTPYGFCKTHTPSYGEAVRIEEHKLVVYVGEIRFLHALKMRLKGYDLIRWWVGSDVLLLHKFPPGRGKLSVILHRIEAYLFGLITYQDWIDGPKLYGEMFAIKYKNGQDIRNLRNCLWAGKHGKYLKQRHGGINIAYYHPNDSIFARWKYGIDFIESFMVRLKDPNMVFISPKAMLGLRKFHELINWIKLDGKQDMSKIYPILDLYVRPSRHDGWPRINAECIENEIPVVYDETFSWTQEKFDQALLEAINKL